MIPGGGSVNRRRFGLPSAIAGRRIVPAAPRRMLTSMTIKANMKQRDLVRLAVLMCGDRPSAKYTRPAKGNHSRNEEPTRGYEPLARGSSTRLITWITPFDAMTSAAVTLALLTRPSRS